MDAAKRRYQRRNQNEHKKRGLVRSLPRLTTKIQAEEQDIVCFLLFFTTDGTSYHNEAHNPAIRHFVFCTKLFGTGLVLYLEKGRIWMLQKHVFMVMHFLSANRTRKVEKVPRRKLCEKMGYTAPASVNLLPTEWRCNKSKCSYDDQVLERLRWVQLNKRSDKADMQVLGS